MADKAPKLGEEGYRPSGLSPEDEAKAEACIEQMRRNNPGTAKYEEARKALIALFPDQD